MCVGWGAFAKHVEDQRVGTAQLFVGALVDAFDVEAKDSAGPRPLIF